MRNEKDLEFQVDDRDLHIVERYVVTYIEMNDMSIYIVNDTYRFVIETLLSYYWNSPIIKPRNRA